MLRLWFYGATHHRTQTEIDVDARLGGFTEVRQGLTEGEAIYESKRCLSCGNCYECDGCYGACPEAAIVKLESGQGYEINYDICTGCGVCFDQCPCHAMALEAEK
jgi:Pyruvate/2-oxoacid:ferredoxin oxidoreductase delta subunit